MTAKPRILLTGAAGGVGSVFRDLAGDRFEIVCLDRRPTPGVPGAIVADLSDLPALVRAATGCAAIVHLGAFPNPADYLTVIHPNNVVGCFNLFEAAIRAGVKRVVFASSVQVEKNASPGDPPTSVTMAPVTRNVYAASKVFGENLGWVYHHVHGLDVVSLRLGLVAVPGKAEWLHKVGGLPSRIALTARDCAAILTRALEMPGVGCAVLPAYSRNAAEIRDLSPLKAVLDYEPQEDAFVVYPPRKRPVFAPWRLRSLYFRLRWKWRHRAGFRRGSFRRWLTAGRPVRRVLMTGAAGHVGTALRAALGRKFDWVCFDRRPTPGVPSALVGDLTDRKALDRAVRGCDAVLHLGGIRDDADFMTELLPNNILGTWHVYQAAAAAGARRVVFASTMQAEDGYGRETKVSVAMPARPLNLYAACKVLGEDLGRAIASRSGLSVIALRLGWVKAPTDPEWAGRGDRPDPKTTLTVPDLAAIVERALAVPNVPYALLPAYSAGAAEIRDLEPLREVLGYVPMRATR